MLITEAKRIRDLQEGEQGYVTAESVFHGKRVALAPEEIRGEPIAGHSVPNTETFLIPDALVQPAESEGHPILVECVPGGFGIYRPQNIVFTRIADPKLGGYRWPVVWMNPAE